MTTWSMNIWTRWLVWILKHSGRTFRRSWVKQEVDDEAPGTILRQSHCEGLMPVNFIRHLMALSGTAIACDTTSLHWCICRRINSNTLLHGELWSFYSSSGVNVVCWTYRPCETSALHLVAEQEIDQPTGVHRSYWQQFQSWIVASAPAKLTRVSMLLTNRLELSSRIDYTLFAKTLGHSHE